MAQGFEQIAERFWNLPSKGVDEATREAHYMDDIIQKAHLDRTIAAHLDGVQSLFDGGAGAGRFTIPLAGRGLQVTHFDISRSMIARAEALAQEAGDCLETADDCFETAEDCFETADHC